MAAEPSDVRRRLDYWLELIQISHALQRQDVMPRPPYQGVRREPMLQERFMFEHYIDGGWCPPAAGRYLTQGSETGGGLGGSVARATAEDIVAACAAAQLASADWVRRGRAVRRAELGQIPARIAAQAVMLAMAEHWDQNWDQGDSAPGLELQCAERQASLVRDIVRTLPSPPVGRQRPASPSQSPAVVKLACAADAAPSELFQTLLPLLYDGRTLVVLLLYRNAEHLPVRLLQLLGIVAAAAPSGVLNVLTGLGAEAGVALMRQHFTGIEPAPVR
ncbi:MAG: aldehyde dehydrogenase family protein [Gammaproteobacteria bacterium]|jgi:aldehyde dehydrogenase|nr:aldehyde dehydrogenase family protein [Gammaproteobacteria bacterium]